MPAINLQLGQLVDLVGLVPALRLVEKRGGTHFYVPHPNRLQLHHKLAEEIGLEAARKLAEQYPQTHVMAPRGAAYLRRQRDLAVLAACKDHSVTKVARMFQMTERNVYLVLQRGPEALSDDSAGESAQRDLFGENAGP